MEPDQLAKRKKIMGRSMRLGHCVCDPNKPCPCPNFKDFDVCECAGEKLQKEIPTGTVKLTDYVRAAGCASKIGKKNLRDVLAGLPEINDPRVLVGSNAGDDAGVIVLNETDEQALILTVDVFAPSVDDAYTFGKIAAANSVSDVYAMGGTPVSALSIIGFPIYNLPNDVMHEILRGGIDKMKEAGIAVIGGHSINDEEIKCGFAVVGSCPKDAVKCNAGAHIGDAIVLTKPLGVGITAFAGQIGRADEKSVTEIAESMATLNKIAAERMAEFDVHAVTDVTGYSLVGHMAEIVKNSEVEAQLDFDSIPLFRQVKELSRQDVLPGAIERNREAVSPDILDFSSLTDAQENILFCPETSGGLLVFLPESQADAYVNQLKDRGVSTVAVIGRVTQSDANGKISVTTTQSGEYTSVRISRQEKKTMTVETTPDAEASCCSSEEQPSCCATPPTDEPSCCASAPNESASTGKTINAAASDAFKDYMSAVMAPGAIDLKNKKLMAIALSVATRCEPCIKINTKAAKEAGANDAEIGEAVSMGVAFGGAPTMMMYNTLKHKI